MTDLHNYAAAHIVVPDFPTTTDGIVQMCKAMIKIASEQPHVLDEVCKEAYVETFTLYLKLKGSYERAQQEEKEAAIALTRRNGAETRVRKFKMGYSEKEVRYKISGMTLEELLTEQKRREEG